MDLDKDIQNNPTIFGKILRGEILSTKVYEDEKILAFKTIEPMAKIHILVIPKKHIVDLREVENDAELLGYLMSKIPKIAKVSGLSEGGFRVFVNNGENAGQEVPHLHFHLVGGEPLPKL